MTARAALRRSASALFFSSCSVRCSARSARCSVRGPVVDHWQFQKLFSGTQFGRECFVILRSDDPAERRVDCVVNFHSSAARFRGCHPDTNEVFPVVVDFSRETGMRLKRANCRNGVFVCRGPASVFHCRNVSDSVVCWAAPALASVSVSASDSVLRSSAASARSADSPGDLLESVCVAVPRFRCSGRRWFRVVMPGEQLRGARCFLFGCHDHDTNAVSVLNFRTSNRIPDGCKTVSDPSQSATARPAFEASANRRSTDDREKRPSESGKRPFCRVLSQRQTQTGRTRFGATVEALVKIADPKQQNRLR